MNKTLQVVLLLSSVLVITGCTSQQEEWQLFLDESYRNADNALRRLDKHINSGLIKNTQLLTVYADVVREQKPEYKKIVDVLELDAGTAGPIFQGLKSRLKEAKTNSRFAPDRGEAAVKEVWNELDLITAAANPDIYGMMLTDPINVLADMSDGQLARVAAMSKEASRQANQTTDMGAGSQLVGNPHYGNWRTDSHGNSFWAWYGKYALFSSLFLRPHYYGSWASGRNYSYYHDYGRSHYTSPAQFKSQSSVNSQSRTKFQKSGKSFQSPYAKTRSGVSATAPKPKARSSSSFNSRFQKSSSARSSSSRTSRSSSGGK